MTDDIEFVKRKASYNDMSPREYCIYQINKWKKNLEKISDDYRDLSEEEFEKRLEKEIQDRK